MCPTVVSTSFLFSKFEAKLVDVMDTSQTRFQSLRRVKRGDHKCPRSPAQAKVDDSADLTESEPWIEQVLSRDRTTKHAISFEEECG